MCQIFETKYTKEALAQLDELEEPEFKKILKAIYIFERVGTKYKCINDLGNGLLIIIGVIVLKKTQKAPKRYIEQALKNIEQYLLEHKELSL